MTSSASAGFVGTMSDKGDHILVVGLRGEVRIEGDPDELRSAQRLIRRLDGFTSLESLVGDEDWAIGAHKTSPRCPR